MSLLIGNGHLFAARYPLWRVWDEAFIVRERVNDIIATEAVIMQATIASVISGGKVLQKALGRLRGDERHD